MYSILFLLLLIKSLLIVNCINDRLNVYPRVPGLEESPYYKLSVKLSSSDVWLEPFNFLTECTDEKMCNTTGMGELLDGWSNTYVNFEMREGAEVEIRITKLSEEGLKGDIEKAVVHPEKAARECFIENGRAHVVIGSTGLFTVDIDGQMDDQDTGRLPPDGRDQYRDALKGGFQVE